MFSSCIFRKNVKRVLFVPYASTKHDDYTNTVKKALEPWGFQVEGVHATPNPVQAVENAESIFVGGGNTFLLLKSLYENGLVQAIQKQVLEVSACAPANILKANKVTGYLKSN